MSRLMIVLAVVAALICSIFVSSRWFAQSGTAAFEDEDSFMLGSGSDTSLTPPSSGDTTATPVTSSPEKPAPYFAFRRLEIQTSGEEPEACLVFTRKLDGSGNVKYEDVSFKCGTGMSREFYNWIDTAIKFTSNVDGRKNGAIVHFDYDYNELSRLTFHEALVTEFAMPALDASSKDPAMMTVKFKPEWTRNPIDNFILARLDQEGLAPSPEADRETLLRRKFGTTERMHQMMQNRDLIVDWAKSAVWSGWHVSCSCRMGGDEDPMAVLDSQCRVRGVQGLRVVDASAMPSVIAANTNITTIAMAEKAADLILNS